MAKDHSFDIVSNVDLQEVRNGVQICLKEIAQRYDFKGTSAGVGLQEKPFELTLTADHDLQLQNVKDMVLTKMAKRGISVKTFKFHDKEEAPGGKLKQKVEVQQGITQEKAKAITKEIKNLKMKVQPRIDGDQIRVSGRQIDDLQSVIQKIKEKDFGIALQVENFR